MAKSASPRQALLGIFILGQLTFMLLSNVLGFVKSLPDNLEEAAGGMIERAVPKLGDDKGHGWQQIDSGLRWWAQLTGQDQEWALFAPAVGKGTGFPCLLLLWNEAIPDQPGVDGALPVFDARNGWHVPIDDLLPGHRLVLSENEPGDIDDYFRIGKCRLRRYEGHLDVNPQPKPGATPADAAKQITDRVHQLRDQYRTAALVYVKWRMRRWHDDHADVPEPDQVLLCVRAYRIHDPDEARGWDGPFLVPLARWQPGRRDDELDWFDFTQQRLTR